MCCVSVSPRWLSWQKLRREHHLVAAAGQRPPDEFLVKVGAVDLGGVDQGHAEVDGPVDRPDRLLVILPRPRAVRRHPHRPEADARDIQTAGLACFIAFLPAYAATNRVRLRDATMVESADAPASVARQSRYA